MGSRADDYRFLQIVDAMASINQVVNLIGLVVETSMIVSLSNSRVLVTLSLSGS